MVLNELGVGRPKSEACLPLAGWKSEVGSQKFAIICHSLIWVDQLGHLLRNQKHKL